MLIRLAYASTLALHCDRRCINEIVDWSAPANMRRGITGILAVDGDSVLQIIEGPETDVMALFDHIRKDDRHFGVVELDRETIDAPHFGSWGMALRPMSDALMLLQSL